MPVTLVIYGVIVLLLMGGLLWRYNKKNITYAFYVLVFLLLGVLAKFVINSYIYPSASVFKNSQYHVIQHTGFSCDLSRNPLTLVDDRDPLNALFNRYKGKVSLSKSGAAYTISTNRFLLPLYVSDATGQNIQSLHFKLANPVNEYDAGAGFSVSYKQEQLDFSLQPFKENGIAQTRYILKFTDSTGKTETDTSGFTQQINFSLPVVAILRQSGLPVSTRLENFCRSLLLTRQLTGGKASEENKSRLLLFPLEESVTKECRITDNRGGAIDLLSTTDHSIALQANQLFHLGYYQRGGNNNDQPVFYMDEAANKTQLRFLLPRRFALPSADSVLATHKMYFLTSSSKEILKNNFAAGYLFPWFNDDSSHQLHVSAYFTFHPASPRDSLYFEVVDLYGAANGLPQKNTIAGDRSFRLATRTASLEWLMEFPDLRSRNYLQSGDIQAVISGYILMVLLIFLLLMRYHRALAVAGFGGGLQETVLIPRLEVLVYMALLPFLLLRLLILWRIGTFPPVEDIEYLPLKDYENAENFWQLIAYGLVPFFVLRLILLLTAQWRVLAASGGIAKGMPLQSKPVQRLISITFLSVVGGIILSVILVVIKLSMSEAIFLFGIYLLALLLAYLSAGLNKRITFHKAGLENVILYWQGQGSAKRWLLAVVSIILMAGLGVAVGILISLAGGLFTSLQRFFNVFVPVSFFLYIYWRFLPGKNEYAINFRIHYFLRILCAVFCAGIFLKTDSGFAIIFLFFSVVLFLVELFFFIYNLKTEKRWLMIASFLSLFLLMLFSSAIISFAYKTNGVRWVVNALLGEDNNIKYRALVHTSQEDKVAAGTYFRHTAFNKLQNAAANKWFINYYLSQPRNSYFQLQPHLRFGVSYPTQTMDLLPLRYVIAEHGEWLIVILLLLLVTISFASGLGFQFSDGVRFSKHYISFAISLLLLVVGLLVWLAVTNRFIFFGQDFPMLSIQAKITTLLFFVLLILMFANHTEGRLKKGREVNSNSIVHAILVFTLLFFLVFDRHKDASTYNMEFVVKQLEDKSRSLNSVLLHYQEELADKRVRIGDAKQLLTLFTATPEYKQLRLQWEEEAAAEPGNENSLFYTSVMEELLKPNSEKFDPDQLLHLIRNNSGRVEIAVNRFYFQMKPRGLDDRDWQGSLVASNSVKTVSVFSDRLAFDFRPDTINHHPLLAPADAGLAYFPPGWLPVATQPLIIYGGRDMPPKARIIFNNLASVTNKSLQARFAYRLMPDDWISINRGTEGRKSAPLDNYFIRQGHSEYLAKNVWLNGRYRLFYPEEDRFIWAYNMGNNVAASYAGTRQYREDYITSIDYPLHKNNESLINRFEQNMRVAFATNKGLNRLQLSVAVMDADGFVWDLQEKDFNYLGRQPFNPNNSNDHYRFMRQLYMERDVRTERSILGSQALLNNYNPGSTMKPIVYAAAMSGARLDWDSLLLLNNRRGDYITPINKPDKTDKKERVAFYAGFDMKYNGFEHDVVNEGTLNPVDYIAKSKNVYHSMIVYLGSFPDTDLDSNNIGKIMISPKQPDSKKENFPLFRYQGKERIFSHDYAPKDGNKFFGSPKAMMVNKLYNNFGLATTQEEYSNDSISHRYMPLIDSNFKRNTQFAQYALPEKSGFLQFRRRVDNFSDRNGLTNTTVGAVVVEVSPLKMADMGIRLFTLNKDLRIRFNRRDTATYYQPFMAGRNWKGLNELTAMYSKTVYKGMYESAYGAAGTSNSLIDLGYLAQQKLYAYCKTGTADVDDVLLRHKTLMVVLSPIELHDRKDSLNPALLRDNRIICIYFSFFNHISDKWNEQDRELIKGIIRSVTESKTFQQYRKAALNDKKTNKK
jgi:hypothetical protein